MKAQVRRNVFETNSSSTHSLTLYSKEDWEAFMNNENVMNADPWNPSLVDIGDVDPSQIATEDNFDPSYMTDYSSNYSYIKYGQFRELDTEILIKEMDDVVAVSIYEEE